MKKILLLFLMAIICHNMQANKISLTKTGGNGTIFTNPIDPWNLSNPTLIPQPTGWGSSTTSTTNTLTYEENVNGLGAVSNWSDYFIFLSECINQDVENELSGVTYLIEITAPMDDPILVGKQLLSLTYPSTNPFASGYHMIRLDGKRFNNACTPINGVTIKSGSILSKAYIKYVDNLYYGGWIKSGTLAGSLSGNNPPVPFPACTNPPACTTTAVLPVPSNIISDQYSDLTKASIGDFVSASFVNDLNIQDVEIDGNIANMEQGGVSGDKGKQNAHTGFSLIQVTNARITDCNAHHFGLDGMSVDGSATDDVTITKCNFEYNCRQGFSWVGGSNIIAKSTSFSHTGKAVGGFASSPGSGLDIEPQNSKDCLGGNTLAYCKDGRFINCTFINNAGPALISDGHPDYANNISFENCKFHDVDGYSVWVKGEKFSFTDCKIWGGFVYGNSGNIITNATKFTRCDFADEEYYSNYSIEPLLTSWKYARGMKFDNCSFRQLHQAPNFMTMYSKINSSSPESDYTTFKDCRFDTYNVPSSTSANLLVGGLFEGKSYFENHTPTKINAEMNGVHFIGNSDACDRNKFDLKGLINWNVSAAGAYAGIPDMILGRDGLATNDGYLDFNVGENVHLSHLYNQFVHVGKNSTLNVKEDGVYSAQSIHLKNRGRVNFEEGSYYAWVGSPTASSPSTMDMDGSTTSEFYMHKGAKYPSALVQHPHWPLPGAVPPDYMTAIGPAMKFDGGTTSPIIHYAASHASYNEAIKFSGGESVRISNNSKFDYLSNADFSIEIAFNDDNSGPYLVGGPVLFEKGKHITIGLQPYGEVFVRVGNSFFVDPLGRNLGDGKCHNIAINFEYTSGVASLSVDGDPLQGINLNPAYVQNTVIDAFDLMIGNFNYTYHPSLTTTAWQGSIGQVRLWDRHLTQDEICHNYKRQYPKDYNGLVADWEMRDGSTTVISTIVADVAPISGSNPIAADGLTVGSVIWLTQNQIGDCVTDANNPDQIGNYKNGDRGMMTILSKDPSSIIEDNLNVYPNPSDGILSIALPYIDKSAELSIVNLASTTLYTKKLSAKNSKQELSLDLSFLSNGVYFLTVVNGQFSITKKVVIK